MSIYTAKTISEVEKPLLEKVNAVKYGWSFFLGWGSSLLVGSTGFILVGVELPECCKWNAETRYIFKINLLSSFGILFPKLLLNHQFIYSKYIPSQIISVYEILNRLVYILDTQGKSS